MKKYLILFFLSIASLSAYSQAVDTTTLTTVGQIVPFFTVTTIDGVEVNISALKGKVVLLDLFLQRGAALV